MRRLPSMDRMINREGFEGSEGNGAGGVRRVNLFHLQHAEKPEAMFDQREARTLGNREPGFIN